RWCKKAEVETEVVSACQSRRLCPEFRTRSEKLKQATRIEVLHKSRPADHQSASRCGRAMSRSLASFAATAWYLALTSGVTCRTPGQRGNTSGPATRCNSRAVIESRGNSRNFSVR